MRTDESMKLQKKGDERVATLLVRGTSLGERMVAIGLLMTSRGARRSYVDMRACQSLLSSATPFAFEMKAVRRHHGTVLAVAFAVSGIILATCIGWWAQKVMQASVQEPTIVIGGGHYGDKNVKARPKTDPMNPKNAGKPGFSGNPTKTPQGQ